MNNGRRYAIDILSYKRLQKDKLKKIFSNITNVIK